MRLVRATAIGFLLLAMLALGGCKKKKPAVPPPQAEAPTVTQPQPEAQPPAPAASEPNRPQPETTQPETTAGPKEAAPAPKPKRKPRHAAAKKTPAPAVPEKPGEKQPGRTVVNNGGTQPATSQLSPSMPNEQAIHQKLSTAQLLEATDYNLRSVSRALTADEQGMVQMIRSYEEKSRQANKDGDTDLAFRFASKAHQLSDELLKH